MPEVQPDETEKDFINRCIPKVLEDGTAKDNEQAAAICYSIFQNAKAEAAKMGNRNNREDRGRIRTIRQAAKQIHDVSLELEPSDTDEDPMNILAKGAAIPPTPEGSLPEIPYTAIKVAGDWELDVLGIPYGGHVNGKDAQGQYFAQDTELYLDKITPLVTYLHGFDPELKRAKTPELIGEVKSWERKSEGVWFRVVLDRTKELAQRVWNAAKRGLAKASSGSVPHLVRVAEDGKILNWAVAELSLMDADNGKRQPANQFAVAIPALKSLYEQSGKQIPVILTDPQAEADENSAPGSPQAPKQSTNLEVNTMEEKELEAKVNELFEQRQKAETAKAEAEAARKAQIEEAVKAEKAKWEAEAAKSNRLPSAPVVAKFADLWKYDNIDAGAHALAIGVMKAHGVPVSEHCRKSLAIKLIEDATQEYHAAKSAMKMAGFAMKSDEVMQQDLTSYGDEWVGVAYSSDLWEKIRVGTFVLGLIGQRDLPFGVESEYIPLESSDPTFYKVAETTDEDSTMKTPVASVTSSKVGTGRKQITLGKMGARVSYSGELAEDSLIPAMEQIRAQIVAGASEQIEYAIIDGDTETGATTNINDIGGTPAATDLHLICNGFRKSPLITTTANSRSAAGGLTADDYLETVKLMGTAGINALDIAKVGFLIDPNVYWKSMQLAEVKTRDVFAAPTIEAGRLTGIWGYKIYVSPNMHYNSSVRKADTAGKVNQDTTANNAYGAILAVRWDQWVFGWKRKLTIETQRIPRADITEITALTRWGLAQRDTEASAITYYVGV